MPWRSLMDIPNEPSAQWRHSLWTSVQICPNAERSWIWLTWRGVTGPRMGTSRRRYGWNSKDWWLLWTMSMVTLLWRTSIEPSTMCRWQNRWCWVSSQSPANVYFSRTRSMPTASLLRMRSGWKSAYPKASFNLNTYVSPFPIRSLIKVLQKPRKIFERQIYCKYSLMGRQFIFLGGVMP